MRKKKLVSEAAIKARLREMTADLRKLRTELQEELRKYRGTPRLPDEESLRMPIRRR